MQNTISSPIHIIGAPFDLCGPRPGSALGPAALRLERLAQKLTELGLNVVGDSDIVPRLLQSESGGLIQFESALDFYRQLAYRTEGAIKNGEVPLMVGGDHSLSIGSISGALRALKGELAVLWIDAHADINSADTTPSRNLHGMPLAALMGLKSARKDLLGAQWQTLVSEMAGKHPLNGDHVAWLGLRDLDEGEKDHIEAIKDCFPTTIQDVDRYGVPALIDKFDRWMKANGCKNLWMSFDVDCLDPALAPGTGTTVRGGLTYREGHLIAEMLAERLAQGPYRLAGLDVVETNPTLDIGNGTAKVAVEWVCSLFGKTILRRPNKSVLG